MNFLFDSFRTPFGIFSVAVDENDRVAATAFGGRSTLAARLGRGRFTRSAPRCRMAREQIQNFLTGRRRDFELRLAPEGTAFQHRVWDALRKIPFGTTASYGEIARKIGKPGAARAVGRANATNPICLIVPCHRVIGANGSLTGFAFGETLKRRLLAHEQRGAGRSNRSASPA